MKKAILYIVVLFVMCSFTLKAQTKADSVDFKEMVAEIQNYEKVKISDASTKIQLVEAYTALKYLYIMATKESYRLADIYKKEHPSTN